MRLPHPNEDHEARWKACGRKRWFPSKLAAEEEADGRGEFVVDDELYSLRVYKCPYAGMVPHYHLTKKRQPTSLNASKTVMLD